MKAVVKIVGRLIVGCVLACCLSRFTPQTFAIEGLHVSVLSSNAILSWPSTTNETYIAQYRHTLESTDSWTTLTNYFPASQTTNITYFVHSNSVDYGIPGSGGGTNTGGGPDPFETNNYSGPAGTNGIAGTGFYQVVRDGAHIYGLTNNSTLSGEVQMPIEIAVDSTDHIESVTFFNSADDSPVIGASAYTNSAGGWIFDWNTVMVENGSNNIYAEVDFTTEDPVSSDNLPVSLNVNNTISFPNYFSRIYGSQMWIYAETIPDAAYDIDMYDEGSNYLGTFSDYADDSGVISFLWDLTDGEGDPYDSTNFFGVFTVTNSSPSIRSNIRPQDMGISTNSSGFQKLVQKPFVKGGGVHPKTPGSSSSATQTWALEAGWSGNDRFVVAYAPLTDPTTDPNTSYRESLMMIGGDGGEYGGVVSTLSEYGLAYQLSPGNVAQTSAFEMGTGADRTNLLSYLAGSSYRNFYFFGHGNPKVIAGVTADTAINSFTISQLLGNFLSGAKPENFHPYRFVFIDGCDVGKGSFCEAFGIPAQALNNSFFSTAGVRSRAFLGFKKSIGFNVSQWDSRSIMLGSFFSEWMANTSLSQCVYDAQQQTYQPMDSSAVIYGATDLQKNSP